MQGSLGFVKPVQINHQPLDPAVRLVVEHVPVETGLVVPFHPLTDFPAHKEQLLARVAIHIAVQQPEVGELLPFVTGHLPQQRALAVHYFVVGERQDEVFGEGVKHGKGHAVVMIPAVNGVLRHVLQRIVHPAHVPLQAEAQAAHIGGSRNHRPRRGLLGNGEHAGVARVNQLVHALQQCNGGQVFPAAVLIGNPLAALA